MNNEIKVNEFIRTKEGIIDKVIIDYKGKCNNPNCNRKHISCEKNYYNEDDIVEHSPNLIDLIQCGDYVNGEQITDIWNGNRISSVKSNFNEEDIETIVTKEMMKSISYKVKQEEN